MKDKERITDKPRTLKELAAYYEVDTRTFKNWLKCKTLEGITRENGYYFSINQVKQIVEHLGEND